MSHQPIAYTYEADYHCPDCTEKRFGRGDNGFDGGFIAEGAIDNEGNEVGAVFSWDEWWQQTDEDEVLGCGTCGEIIAEVKGAVNE